MSHSAKVDISKTLSQLGINAENLGASTGSHWLNTSGATYESYSPVDGKCIATVKSATPSDYETVVAKAGV